MLRAKPSLAQLRSPVIPACFSCSGVSSPDSRMNFAASKAFPCPWLMLAMAPNARAAPGLVAAMRRTGRLGIPSRLARASRLWPFTT